MRVSLNHAETVNAPAEETKQRVLSGIPRVSTQVSMSKFVLQTFHVTDTFLQGVRQKASIYPEDINLAKVCGALFWKICAKVVAYNPWR